jgi:hypothetical protein
VSTELTETLKGLEEQVSVIKDAGLRRIAFEKLLEAALPSGKARASEQDEKPGTIGASPKHSEAGDIEGFFSRLNHDKPADNALAIAAYHYSQYGSAAFTTDEIREIADDVGVTVPERLDMTYVQAKREGKAFFRRAGRGAFRPTVHGESYFKKTYQVTKGTKRKATEQADDVR